ncbi:MAG: T9SS type A sorting domain-containing protein [Muribaculaceae bacterium]|nr:T9SS type A sorting domain-containing protein [Muribaculaceae bacterium]
MKVFYFSIFAFLSISLFSPELYAETIYPIDKEQSACKGFDYEYLTRSDEESDHHTTLLYDDGCLTLTVYDIMEQCGAYLDVECRLVTRGEIHFVIIDKSEMPTDCICKFDVECKYEGITPGYYDIYVENEFGTVLAHTSATIESGCELHFSNPSGVEEIQVSSSGILKFSASKMLSIFADGTTSLEAYDAQGRFILKMEVEGNRELSLSSLPKGIYLLKASNGAYRESLIIRI